MEVTQVYITLLDAPVKTPKLELIAYTKTALAGQSTHTIKFKVPADKLRYVDEQGERIAYSGRLAISVGSGQPGFVTTQQKVESIISIK